MDEIASLLVSRMGVLKDEEVVLAGSCVGSFDLAQFRRGNTTPALAARLSGNRRA